MNIQRYNENEKIPKGKKLYSKHRPDRILPVISDATDWYMENDPPFGKLVKSYRLHFLFLNIVNHLLGIDYK